MTSNQKTRRMLRRPPILTEGVSVIVPVQNDAQRLPRFFEALHRTEVLEVLICDQGSTDGTSAVARDSGAHVFRCAGDLAQMLNSAAATARGSALWFLRPNARPPRLAAPIILDALAEAETMGGYFTVMSATPSLSGWARSWRLNLEGRFRGRVGIMHGPFLSHGIFTRLGGCSGGDDPTLGMMTALRKSYRVRRLADLLRVQS